MVLSLMYRACVMSNASPTLNQLLVFVVRVDVDDRFYLLDKEWQSGYAEGLKMSTSDSWKLLVLLYSSPLQIVHGEYQFDNDSDDNNVTLISKLDMSSPLHLHPNDSATLTVVLKTLKGLENYSKRLKEGILVTDPPTSGNSSRDNNVARPSGGGNIRTNVDLNLLGHPSDQVLNVLQKELAFDNNDLDHCEICQKSKQTREPFPLSEHKTSVLAELVHLDLWGPYKVTSRKGLGFFLTKVDDYTRSDWFNKVVKAFRSDNGGEFVNQKFSKFCAENGIIHQTTCAYTPQQNGIVERKHRHLLNVARSLLLPQFHMQNGKILLLNMYFNKKPGLKHLRVFGCLCYATVLNLHDKFGSRAEKCVLVGYASFKKGYKLYSLERKQFIYYRDAPRQCNASITQTLFEHGFIQSKSDYSLFTKTDGNSFIALLVYVDDIIITGNNVGEIEKFKVYLNTKYKIKDLDLLSDFGLLACKPSATPLEQNLTISNEPSYTDLFIR
ncbi:putative RNA-directed DNA polymerase [Tanacetum coccineum]